MVTERISIELTNRCGKQCHFCYNHSSYQGNTLWQPEELIAFVLDCLKSGTKAVSFGGGEPLEYPEVFTVLQALQGKVFRSLTSNGLKLDDDHLSKLVDAQPDKVHISIHFPENQSEVDRVISQVKLLESLGIRSGINLLVAQSQLEATAKTARQINQAGISAQRVVYLPMRGTDTPTPKEVARVAGNQPFQSMSCLTNCAKSDRFCSISWDKQVAWCSYTTSRQPLPSLTAQGLDAVLNNLGLNFCG